MKNKLILIVEDQRQVQSLISIKLERAGFEVAHCYDGAEALKYLESEIPDLVILDLMLPLVSGKDVLLKLKNTQATQAVPVLILTARTKVSDVAEYLALGADDYVRKPFDPDELVKRVRLLVA